IDLQDYYNSAELVCEQISRQASSARDKGGEEPELGPQRAIRALNERSARQRVVIAFDHYEKAGEFDRWLRESFLPYLSSEILIVIAGRFPLAGPWRQSPSLRRLIVSLPLAELAYGEVRDFVRRQGISDPLRADAIWTASHGHPLTLSLLTQPAVYGADDNQWLKRICGDTFEELLEHWLLEMPGGELRPLLYAAAVPRTFNQDILNRICGSSVSDAMFDRLLALSFVYRTERGWSLHDIVRETLLRSLKLRMPESLKQYRRRLIEWLWEKLRNKERSTDAEDAAALAELLSLSGNATLRAHFRHAKEASPYTETVEGHTLTEALAYVEHRLRHPAAWTVSCSDPETDRLFHYDFTPEQTMMRIRHIDVRALLRVDPRAVKLIRSPEGTAIGLTAAMPIHRDSIEYLRSSPLSRAYFSGLGGSELEAYRVPKDKPEGLFLYAIDMANLEDERHRSNSIRQLLELLLSGNLLITSPPPHPFYADGHEALGFERLEGAGHLDYDGKTPTPTYAVDTRKLKLQAYLTRILQGVELESGAIEPEPRGSKPMTLESKADLNRLTAREREVAELVIVGHTNPEIAKALFVSDATVKKHINAILSKYGLKNRTQLTNVLLEQQRRE
ncbi:MAG: LuxR family transcriptional regulator, partial [Paenibacillus sp.]|nr:LuxR family transcriptional regulator [Paenibacillus sp.]